MIKERFGANVKRLREKARLSQRQLAQQTGLRQHKLSQIETGKASGLIFLDKLARLSEVLGTSVDDLLYTDGPIIRDVGTVDRQKRALSLAAAVIQCLQTNDLFEATLRRMKTFTIKDGCQPAITYEGWFASLVEALTEVLKQEGY